MRRARRLPLEELQPYLLPVPDPAAPLDFKAVFGNDHPVEMEVGFGKGLFLLNAALARPGVNWLGVEIERKYQLYAATRVAKRGLSNVRLACADARLFVRHCVPTGALQAVHIYFPDPWWKKRHHKRRLFTGDFAAQCARVLRPGGRLHLATDVEEYFGLITGLTAGLPDLRRRPPPEERPPEHDMDYLTNFERKARQKGMPVFRAEYEKVAPEAAVNGTVAP